MSKLVCYVTGAGQGLGKATALRLSKLGAKVMVVDLSEEKCKQVVAGVFVCVCVCVCVYDMYRLSASYLILRSLSHFLLHVLALTFPYSCLLFARTVLCAARRLQRLVTPIAHMLRSMLQTKRGLSIP